MDQLFVVDNLPLENIKIFQTLNCCDWMLHM